MTQYDDRVEKRRQMNHAETWAKGVAHYHSHSLDTMWYDNRPKDTANMTRRVQDTLYNNGVIRRELDNGAIVIMGKQLKGDNLLNDWIRNGAPDPK